ncbi:MULTISPECIES: hypothetical protein [unclassified Treponema]|uniref:hypothetical protein n=1 Tax=unclassified Treponema TaxID=2638727 RepID=UPI0020A314CA|nr:MULTISPECIES: hypothetical protein [unclassified Treponema]UTC66597.1 hypothetical protein E4O06_11655 [Treponema sp. OMZ 789]UTC69330.1 hypothetical protein E4O01_11795 [Treponema sp. OMZ 790]UTC72044.1 hypothetical protein E4O02_11890 [Treponema sp. OMZ 791]
MFLDNRFLIAESVRKNTWDLIESVVIDISTGKYIGLNDRYHRVCIEENGIKLENDYTGKKLHIKDINLLEWEKNI